MRMRQLVTSLALVLVVYGCVALHMQQQWSGAQKQWTKAPVDVYELGAENELVETLPEGAWYVEDDTVGDTWQQIAYMRNGKWHTGLVRMDAEGAGW